MQKKKMQTARMYIQKKEYSKASALLETMMHSDDSAMTLYMQVQQLIESKKANSVTSWKNNRTIALLIAVVILIGLVLFLRAQNGF